MKPCTFLLSIAVITTALTSCKKEENSSQSSASSYPDFSQLKVGNYWVYQQFEIDSSGNAAPRSVFDSCYVEMSTLINNQIYFKVVKPDQFSQGGLDISFQKDSLHYVVDSNGKILFSSQDTSNIFDSKYVLASMGDTVCQVIKKMEEMNAALSTPAGSYTTCNAKETFNMYPNWSMMGNPRYKNTRYSENIGIVIETLPFFAGQSTYIERRLLRFHVQ